MGYHPAVLAPTGIVAYTAGGQTIDRFFGLNMHQQHTYNPLRVDDYLKVNQKTVLLIDECSMLSAQKLEEIHNQATIATENNEIFGGLKTVFFGDMAQLPPVALHQGFFFQWPLISLGYIYELKMPMRQSAAKDEPPNGQRAFSVARENQICFIGCLL
ncbi:hypothetical protein [Parasitella parasitica]|uniref:ATP-dependent DNA helicase n=1 Tax=Parasitella parasitica TaxID=35722 RepID=A0A0B7NBM3_9FUNG|nr:hypothetical protein [Parasitella parasitica]